MSTWGANTSTGNTVPTWYQDLTDAQTSARPNHPLNDDNLFATDEGWVREVSYTDNHGNARRKREVVIASGQLAANIGTLHVTDMKWGNVASQSTVGSANVATFEITFNMPVSWATAPTAYANGTTWAGAAATLVSGNTTNKLTYRFTTNGTNYSVDSLNLPHHIINGTIIAWDPDANTAIANVTGITGNYNTGRPLTSKPSSLNPS